MNLLKKKIPPFIGQNIFMEKIKKRKEYYLA